FIHRGTSGNKLNLLVNKLHEYLAHSCIEDSNGSPASEASYGISVFTNSVKSNRNSLFIDKMTNLLFTGQRNKRFTVGNSPQDNASEVLVWCTVLVRPEPVDNGRDEFRGPEFRSRKLSFGFLWQTVCFI
uniref:Uncharacterized protein n=1 Tax=Cyprinodon variegatus TaxID=28743 RepID=A0A3Q2DIW7_CYPVA